MQVLNLWYKKGLDCESRPIGISANNSVTAFSSIFPELRTNFNDFRHISSRSRVYPRQSVRNCAAFTQKYVRPFRAGPGKTELADTFCDFDLIPRMVMVSDNRTYGDITTADRSSAQSLAVPKL